MASEGKQYGVGVVGLDHWYAGIGAVDGLQGSKRAKVVAVAHRDEEKLREFAAERGIPVATTEYDAIASRDDVDVVVTACTTAENVDLCIDAARRGKHIVSVKPFAMTLADADRLIEVVRQAGVLFCSFDAMYRFSTQGRQYKDWIKEGRIGTPISATVIMRASLGGASMDWPGRRNDNTWWRNPRLVPGGGWIDHAIYQVDFLRWLLDDEVARVTGMAKTLAHPELAKELEDFGVGLFEFRGGAVATIEVTWTAPASGGLSQTQLVGTEGQIVFDPTLTGKLAVSGNFESPAGRGWTMFSPPGRRGGGGGAVEHLLECLETGQTPAATIDDSRATLAACLAFYEAARTGQTVTV
ncbi:MAG TPA: Gfo/Idh/MocA family oxidoreductase [Chloroflexota bacterium]|nr:Gfo/Idh/MocA family oxidoreductase [Chloroflexota bacterium]